VLEASKGSLEMNVVRNLTAVAAVAATLTIAAQARANTIDFFLATAEGSTTTTPTMGGSPATDPQVEVIVDELTNTTATVEFEISSGTFKAPVGINVNGFFDVTGITGSGNGNGQSLPCGYGQTSTCGAGGTSHAGSFNFETSAVNGGTITIDLTAENGTTWANALSVLTPNSNGWEAADNMASSPQDLGYATPLPGALPLFGSALGGLGLFGWRRKRKAQALAA
jgi:hypothetical protein